MLDELRRDGLLENDPERARGFEVVIAETTLPSVKDFPGWGEGEGERTFREGDEERPRWEGLGEMERSFLNEGALSLIVG